MAIEAVLFDFGNTLISTRLDWPRVVPEQLAGLGAALDGEFAGLDGPRLGRDFLFLRRQALLRAERVHTDTPAVDSLRAALALQGLDGVEPALLQRGVDAFFAPEQRRYSVFLGIPETLHGLRELGLKLAVVSNATCGGLVRRALQGCRLLGLFERVVVSCEVGRRKPAPEVFAPVLEGLGAAPSAAVMVGDLLATDVAGANLAGMRSVLVDFFGDGKRLSEHPPRPDALIRRPQELVGLCKNWLR
jgi:FMN phosphatase YigB (HAD superfamily)